MPSNGLNSVNTWKQKWVPAVTFLFLVDNTSIFEVDFSYIFQISFINDFINTILYDFIKWDFINFTLVIYINVLLNRSINYTWLLLDQYLYDWIQTIIYLPQLRPILGSENYSKTTGQWEPIAFLKIKIAFNKDRMDSTMWLVSSCYFALSHWTTRRGTVGRRPRQITHESF